MLTGLLAAASLPTALPIPESEGFRLAHQLKDAVTTRNWLLVIPLGVIALVWALRTAAAYFNVQALLTKRAGALMALALGFGTTMVTGLTAGLPLFDVVLLSLFNAAAPTGGYITFRRVWYGESGPASNTGERSSGTGGRGAGGSGAAGDGAVMLAFVVLLSAAGCGGRLPQGLGAAREALHLAGVGFTAWYEQQNRAATEVARVDELKRIHAKWVVARTHATNVLEQAEAAGEREVNGMVREFLGEAVGTLLDFNVPVPREVLALLAVCGVAPHTVRPPAPPASAPASRPSGFRVNVLPAVAS